MKQKTLPSFPPEAEVPRSALPRAIDFNYPSNRFVAGGMVVTVIAARLLGQKPLQALGTALAGMAGWSSARELDPDHPETAEIAFPIAAGAALLAGLPNPVASFSAVSSLRVLTASVGHRANEGDVLALAAQSMIAGLMGERVAAAMPGAALWLSVQEDDHFSVHPDAPVMAGAALLPNLHRVSRHSVVADLMTLAALGTFGTLDRPEKIRSSYDSSPRKLSDDRVQRARQLALGTLAAALLTRQTRSLTPLASAVLSAGWRRASSK